MMTMMKIYKRSPLCLTDPPQPIIPRGLPSGFSRRLLEVERRTSSAFSRQSPRGRRAKLWTKLVSKQLAVAKSIVRRLEKVEVREMAQVSGQEGPRPSQRNGRRVDIGGAPVVDAFPNAHVANRNALSILPHNHTSDRNRPRTAMFGKKARWYVLSRTFGLSWAMTISRRGRPGGPFSYSRNDDFIVFHEKRTENELFMTVDHFGSGGRRSDSRLGRRGKNSAILVF